MGIPVAGTGAVTEDTELVDDWLTTSGDVDLLLTDDTGAWSADVISGTYGSKLAIDENGSWTYRADNDHPAISALEDGDTLTEVFTVSSINGTTTVTITINGHSEPPCFVAGTMITTATGARCGNAAYRRYDPETRWRYRTHSLDRS